MLGWICYEEEGKKAKEHTVLGGAAGCMLLSLADKRLTVSLCARIEGKDCTDTALLAALVSADALKAEDIRVERVIFPLSPNFP